MNLPKNDEKNKYFYFTEEELKAGELKVFRDKFGDDIILIECGEHKDKSLVIALVKFDNIETRGEIVKDIKKFIFNPSIRDINNIEKLEKRYYKNGFELTPEAKEIFVKSSEKDEIGTVAKTYEYDYDSAELKKIYYEKIEESDYITESNRLQYLKDLEKNDPEAYRRCAYGASIMRKIEAINNITLPPETYEEAQNIEEKLNKIEGFERKAIIENMKNNPANESYRKFMKIKFLNAMRERIKATDDINGVKKDIKDDIMRDKEITEYILLDGKMPIGEEAIEYLTYLENTETKEEDLYVKEVDILYQNAEAMKTELYEKNIDALREYCDVLEKFGIIHELRPKKLPEKSNPSGYDFYGARD